MSEDDRLFDALKAKKSEAFWKAQKARILGRLKPGRPGVAGWAWAPAAAALALGLFWTRRPAPPAAIEAPPQAEWALLEQLDLLEDLETLEKLEDTDA